jgi:hydroxymethylpyrimidine/phosphomethylpyrimidine kinase
VESTDLLVTATASIRVIGDRIATRNTHGTGCTLSAAIAAGLARGRGLTEAVRDAKEYITSAIGASDRLSIGNGPGPVHHFFRWW